jgi:micrococcal nuclease
VCTVRIAAALCALAACAPHGDDGLDARGNTSCGPATATVARVIDGDTIVLASGERVRYLMLDAPETTLGHHDCYGSNATEFNTDLVAGKDVELRYDVQCEDEYGRLLAYVTVAGTEVNPLLVERGYACMLHIPPNGDDRVAEFEDLQAIAREHDRGVWACNPLPPACR